MKKRKKQTSSKTCFFCDQKSTPDYKETQILEKFLSERGKILARSKTGVCAKHQRRLGKAVKRARFLALLPYVPSYK